MKISKLEENRKKALLSFDRSYNIRPNTIKPSVHNSWSHNLACYILALELMKNGSLIYNEVIFKSRKRCDILEVSHKQIIIYEIMHSEFINNIRLKQEDYPFQIIPLDADEIIEDFFRKWNNGSIT